MIEICEARLPKAFFTGGFWTWPFGPGVSAPFGHLEFDDKELSMWSASDRVDAERSDVVAIRISTGILGVRVLVVWKDGRHAPVFFGALTRKRVQSALLERGWPVEETKWGRRVKPRRQ